MSADKYTPFINLKRQQLETCRELLGIYATDCRLIREQLDAVRADEPTLSDEDRRKWNTLAESMREMELKSAEFVQLEHRLKAEIQRMEADGLAIQARMLPKRDLTTRPD